MTSHCRYPTRLILNALLKRNICTSSRKDLFWEPDSKGGYGKPFKLNKETLSEGLQSLRKEFQLFKEEIVTHWEADPAIVSEPGTEFKLWEFKSPKDFEKWETTADSDNQEGYSKCTFGCNENGHGLFSGVLSTDVPKDGKIKRAGYCTIRTHRARKSFKRDSYWDWSCFTHLVIKCRGDGRSYMVNLHSMGYFDNFWNDIYHYPLYTRGGPYWQVTRIPFSKFFLSSKGRIQDLQSPILLDKVSHLGFTAADSINGPFQLEIDYIAILFDPSEQETFAYEMYKLPKGIAAT